jgi:mannose-6-phosphate isomerase
MILKLKPACKDYLWGGTRLREQYGVQSSLDPLAEAWVLSCHPDGPSTIQDGPDAGTALEAWVERQGKAVLGANCQKFDSFPILTKFIDAKKNLSIQVHPSNAYAQAHEGQYGKTEMWYILDCEPGAFLYYGFDHEISKKEFERRIADNTLTEVLNAAPVHKGDVFFIPSGTLHAICKGIVIAEIQQNSNVTYRVYDYGRLGADGKPRALHIAQALDVTECKPPKTDWDFGGHLAKCDYFTVDVFHGSWQDTCDAASFTSLLFVEGKGALTCGTETRSAQKGDSFFLPAGSGAFEVKGDCTVLRTRVGTD